MFIFPVVKNTADQKKQRYVKGIDVFTGQTIPAEQVCVYYKETCNYLYPVQIENAVVNRLNWHRHAEWQLNGFSALAVFLTETVIR